MCLLHTCRETPADDTLTTPTTVATQIDANHASQIDAVPTPTVDATHTAPEPTVDTADAAPPQTVDGVDAAPPLTVDGADAAPPLTVDHTHTTPAHTVDGADAAPALTVDAADAQSDPVVESHPVQSGRFYLFRSLLADPVPESSSGGDPPESHPVAEVVAPHQPVPDPEPADGLCRKILLHVLAFCFTIILVGALVNLSLPNYLICEQDQFINRNGQCTDCPWGHVCDGKELVFNPVPDTKEFLTAATSFSVDHFEEWLPHVMQILSMTQIVTSLPLCVRDVLSGHHRWHLTHRIFKAVHQAIALARMPVATVVSEAEVEAFLSQIPTIPWVPVATAVSEAETVAADVSMASLSLGRVMNTMLFFDNPPTSTHA